MDRTYKCPKCHGSNTVPRYLLLSPQQVVAIAYTLVEMRHSQVEPRFKLHRYTLTFTGKDETGEARFFAYDDQSQQMIKTPCEAIMVSTRGRDGLPLAIENIIDKTFVFSVDLGKDACKGDKYRQYEVKAVLDRPRRRSANQTQLLGFPTSTDETTQPESSAAAMTSPQHQSDLLQIVPAMHSVIKLPKQ